ncbi:hypothetical protein MRY82_06625 [bacterium]|nr:hypothetical protein [bacterium]
MYRTFFQLIILAIILFQNHLFSQIIINVGPKGPVKSNLSFEERIELLNDNVINHEYDSEGYLIIRNEKKLNKYINRAKNFLLQCEFFFFAYNYKYQFLERNDLLGFIIKKRTSQIGSAYFDSNTCGMWDYEGKQNHLYFSDYHANSLVSDSLAVNCKWEYLIPHEVLHAANILHREQDKLFEQIGIKLKNDVFDRILKECKINPADKNIEMWWVNPRYDEKRPIHEFGYGGLDKDIMLESNLYNDIKW